jgi:putative hydrolase of HD superfamily
LPEARLLDFHKVSQRYLRTSAAEARVRREQFALLPAFLRKDCEALTKKHGSPIARDADLLECAFQAKEYEEEGFRLAADWRKRIAKCLKTKSAKRLFRELGKRKSGVWWAGLKKELSKER